MSDIINIPTVENSTLLAQNQLLTAQNEILQAQTEQLTAIARNLTSLVVSGITLKGTIGTGGTVTALPSTHGKGDAYIVIKAGTYAGASCAVGDVLVALGTSGTSANDWSRIAGFMASDGAAKYAIENYAGSSLLGTNQTIVSAFNALNSKKYELGATLGNFLNNNDDLNQFYTPGTFACKTNVTAASLGNCPTTSAFKLIVEFATGNGTPCQTIIEYNTGTRYYRYTTKADGTGWSPWYKFEGTRVS